MCCSPIHEMIYAFMFNPLQSYKQLKLNFLFFVCDFESIRTYIKIYVMRKIIGGFLIYSILLFLNFVNALDIFSQSIP